MNRTKAPSNKEKIYMVYTKEWCGFNSVHYYNRTILLCIPCTWLKATAAVVMFYKTQKMLYKEKIAYVGTSSAALPPSVLDTYVI